MKWNIQKIQSQHKKKNSLKYLYFWGHQKAKDGGITKSCFSQWWPCKFSDGKHTYSSAEQYMMSEKARIFNDLDVQREILKCNDPKKIKALGRKIKNFEQLKWDENKCDIVLKGNQLKFSQDNKLKEYLLKTKEKVLVEASPVDKIWGVGLAENDENIKNPLLWKGENLLGFVLMEVRDQLDKLEE